MTNLGELCNRTVFIAHADEPALEAARRMRDRHVGCLVVVEETPRGRVPIAVVTDRDLVVGLLATRPRDAESVRVRDVMSPRLVSAREEETLADALARMRAFGVRRIVVVDRAGVLQGVFAVDDVLQHVAENLGEVVALFARERSRERARTTVP